MFVRLIKNCLVLIAVAMAFGQTLPAQPFVHPGSLHTLADLNRMKTNVLAGNHPWIDDWNVLITDYQAQTNYGTHVNANMGASRQNADLDAHAAYLNFIRWYVSGDANYANKATNILNQWAAAVNAVPSGTDIPGLIGIAIAHFAEDGELLRTYSGWKAADFQTYTNMMVTYLYPVCNDFLTNHNGACISSYWANWDACNIEALIAMGVLCDNANIYNQGVDYFETGAGVGSISNAVPYLYSANLGQWQESGRDQEHAQLGVGELAAACQTAWNQGLDLYGFANNRLLAGAEYVARYNLEHPVPYTTYNNCVSVNQYWISVDGLGRLDDRPIWELIYNHYAVLQGLSAPNTTAMAQLYRLEHGSVDHFGYGTLTYTLNATDSPYPPAPVPAVPSGLTARGGISQVVLNWTPVPGDVAKGYNVLRSTTSGGPFTSIANWTNSTLPSYTDTGVTNGTAYYYVVSANNQSGASVTNSTKVNATPTASGPVPAAWTSQDIGVVTNAGSAAYASAGDNTFIVTGAGTGIGGTGDGGFNYTYLNVTNDFTIIARLTANNADQMGLMMRASLATNAYLVQFFMADNARQSIVGVRSSSTGGNLNHYDYGDQFTYLPAWYKLTRSGNTFNAYQSADGVSWFLVDSVSVTMPANYYAGLAINNGSATFDNVVYTNAAVTGTFAPPAAPGSLTATAVASGQVYLAWTAVTNAVGYNVKRSTVNGGPYTNLTTATPAINFYDATAVVNTTYYYVVTAINGGGESANSSPANAIVSGTLTVWSGSVSTNWDVVTTTNWLQAGIASTYSNGAAVWFDDTAVSSRVNLAASVRPGSVTFYNSALAYVLTSFGANGINGANSIIKNGTGTLELAGTNTFSGGLTIMNGTVQCDNSNALGTGAITLGDGASANDAALLAVPGVTFGNTNPIVVAGGGGVYEIQSTGGKDYHLSGGIALNDALTVSTTAGGALFVDGIITSGVVNPVLTIDGGGTTTKFVELTANNAAAFTGDAVVVNKGDLKSGNVNSLSATNTVYLDGTATLDNGSQNLTIAGLNDYGGGGTVIDAGTGKILTLAGGGSYAFSGVINHTGGIVKTNTGTQVISGANTFSGPITVSQGKLVISTLHLGYNVFTVTNGATLGVTNLGNAQSAGINSLTLGSGAPTTLEFQNVSNTATPLMAATNVTLKGACTILITGTNSLTSGGTYPLVNYTGTFTGTFGNFTLQMPAGWSGVLSSNAHQIAVSVLAVPAAPTSLSARAGDARAVLNWSASANATGYFIRRSTTNGGAYAYVIGNYGATSYTNAGLSNGVLYYYVVTATNAAGESANSPQASALPIASASTPVSFTVTNGLLEIGWPADHVGWLLQAQTNPVSLGLGTNWLTVPGSDGGNQYANAINPTNGSVFFRLVHP